MDPQRLMLKGRVAEIEERLHELEALIDGDVDSITTALFVAVHGFAGLKVERANIEMAQLVAHHAEYLAKTADLAALREKLG